MYCASMCQIPYGIKQATLKCLMVLGTSTVTEEDLFLQQCEDVPQVRVSTLNEVLLNIPIYEVIYLSYHAKISSERMT